MDKKQLAINFARSLKDPKIEKIILFGSVARGEDKEDSDIDLLIITNSDNIKDLKEEISNKAWDLLLATGEYISLIIRSKSYYEKNKNFSFLSNVNEDGVVIG
ncbi:MAG: nucleotidyltransferase domain-containing protein [Methanobacteriaceae archaeon]|jgi:predicted nucleotidyltransferase|nr:nucleotidyltransferase domain-containing protein [Candidatus Methanorudis spinitermitis]